METLALALDSATCALRDCTEMSPAGAFARTAVGLTLIALALVLERAELGRPVRAALWLRSYSSWSPMRPCRFPPHTARGAQPSAAATCAWFARTPVGA